MKKKKRPKIIIKFFSLILMILSLLLVGLIFYFNVLSNTLNTIVISTIMIILLINLLILNIGNWKTGILITLFLSTIYGFVSYALLKANNLMDNLSLDYKTYNYSLIVLNDSKYSKIKDIEDKKIGYYNDDSQEINKSISKLSKKTTFNEKEYEDTHELANSLVNKDVDAILLESSYINILNENMDFNNNSFIELTKVIYTYSIVVKTEDNSNDIDITKNPFNIYVSGIDTFGEISSVSRSDVNMVISVNPQTREILLTSIPRDYYVPLHGKSGYNDKLTHAGMYGTDMSIKTIEDLLGIEINYYVKVNFTSVIDIIDAIGGVSVYSDYDFTSIDGYAYTKGYNDVDGIHGLSFARERKAFALGDRQRVKDQQELFKAIFKKCTNPKIITKYSKLIDSMYGKMSTNLKMNRLTSFAKLQLTNKYEWNINTYSLAGGDSSNYTYSAPKTRAYVMMPYRESVEYASELIEKIINNENLDSEEIKTNTTKYLYNGTPLYSENSKTSNENKKTNPPKQETTVKEAKLEAKLIRSSIEFESGKEFIYHGINANYGNLDVSKEVSLNYSVNGKILTTQSELISYVSDLKPGNYTIIYNVSYKNDTVILKENVTIKESLKQKEEALEDDDKIEDSLKLNED